MNNEKLIEKYEKMKASKKKLTSVDLVLKDLRSLDEPEPLPFKLKDVVGRIRGFDPTTQTRWLNDILKELGGDYGSMKYRDGYEQGKLEGMLERDKATIPQYIADKIEYCKESGDWDLFQAMDYCFNFRECSSWLENSDNQEKFALAWIFGYEVEREPKYIVKFKGFNPRYIILKYQPYDKTWFLGGEQEYEIFRQHHTRKELEEAGFGWIFSCEGIEVEE